MRKCLAPFFVGKFEPGLDEELDRFDLVLCESLAQNAATPLEAIAMINVAIRDFVAHTIAGKCTPLVLCGDCLSAIGCLAGIEKCGSSLDYLLWLDAHGDFHTYQTTISGHLGGMPLAMITGRGEQEVLAHTGLTPISDNRVCHVGARDLEAEEHEALRNSGIMMSSNLLEAAARIPRTSSVWIHFDTDYINPLDAPAMRYPVAGGPRAEEVRDGFATISRQFRIVGLSISAWAPHLDHPAMAGSTAMTCRQIVSEICSL